MDEGQSTPLRRLRITLGHLLVLAAITHRFFGLKPLKQSNQLQRPIAILLPSLHTNGKR